MTAGLPLLEGGAEESESREIRSIRYSNIWHKARLLPTQHGKGAPIHKLSDPSVEVG